MIIIGISGFKKSGKSTLMKFIRENCYDAFEFAGTCPHAARYPVRNFHHVAFAEPIKRLAVDWFGLNKRFVYGPDEDKNRPCGIKWGDLPHYTTLCLEMGGECPRPDAEMTGREFMQQLGSGIFRRLYADVFVRLWKKEVSEICRRDPYAIVINDDLRFVNEAAGMRSFSGACWDSPEATRVELYRLGRPTANGDTHDSETSWGEVPATWYVAIDNAAMNQEQTFFEFLRRSSIRPTRAAIIMARYADNLGTLESRSR